MRRYIPLFATILPVALSLITGSAAHAGPTNLVQNGGFETENTTSQYCTVSPCAQQMTTTSFRTDGGSVPLWNSTAPSTYTGLYSTILSDPAGGNIAGADGAYQVGAITQTISGLEKGGDYAVTFWYAGAQQYNFTGNTTEAFTVGLGSQSFETPVLNNLSHGFTGWYQQSFVFEATGTSEVLSFLAVGTPSGEPPFSLLDGVTMFEVPEPATWAMLGAGVLGLCFAASRARRANAV